MSLQARGESVNLSLEKSHIGRDCGEMRLDRINGGGKGCIGQGGRTSVPRLGEGEGKELDGRDLDDCMQYARASGAASRATTTSVVAPGGAWSGARGGSGGLMEEP